MTNQIINVGSAEQAGDGESIRSAFVKINENFTETYDKWGNIVVDGSTISTSDESDIQVQGHIIPSADATYDLGSPSRQWRSMYVSTNTIYINNTPISVDGYGNITVNGSPVSGMTILDFGEGFSLTANDKIVTNKLYSTNLTQPNQHYRLELDTNGVVHLPDQSIINGATLKSVAGNYAGITAGPIGKDEDSWMWVDSGGAFIATDYSTNAHTWAFDNNGKTTFPNGETFNSGTLKAAPGDNVIKLTDRTASNFVIVSDQGAFVTTSNDDHFWQFNNTGGLVFPDDTIQTTAFPGFPDLVVIGGTAPDTGILWFNTQEARVYIKYDEQWVDASPTVLVPPNTNPTLESVTFNDATVQTTAWSGSVSYNNITDAPTFVGGGNASTWLTAG